MASQDPALLRKAIADFEKNKVADPKHMLDKAKKMLRFLTVSQGKTNKMLRFLTVSQGFLTVNRRLRRCRASWLSAKVRQKSYCAS